MNPKHALVADDEASIRDVLRYRLQRLDYTVCEVGDGAEARRALAEHVFDLVVIDVHMPDGGGLAVIREIKSRGYRARVLAISGGGEHLLGGDSLNLALNMGANAMLAKPFTDAELLKAIDLAMRDMPDTPPQSLAKSGR
jgi:DNA-binding response OmpR family regulator